MSEDQLLSFREAVKANAELREKLKTASDLAAVLAIAKEAGFTIEAQSLEEAGSELSDGDLERIAGGGFWDDAVCVFYLSLCS
jgi:predicted ribosomally synthesized peptide with nif11-like leader